MIELQRIHIEQMLMKIKLNIIKFGHIFQQPYRLLIIGDSRSGKTNALINLINKQNDIDKNLFVCKRFE